MPTAPAPITDANANANAHASLDQASAGATATPTRRLRRLVAYGPRCPDCAGPLAFGEGCSLCPVCGYSGCTRAR